MLRRQRIPKLTPSYPEPTDRHSTCKSLRPTCRISAPDRCRVDSFAAGSCPIQRRNPIFEGVKSGIDKLSPFHLSVHRVVAFAAVLLSLSLASLCGQSWDLPTRLGESLSAETDSKLKL